MDHNYKERMIRSCRMPQVSVELFSLCTVANDNYCSDWKKDMCIFFYRTNKQKH